VIRAWPVETAAPLLVAPAGTCDRCGCNLSRYRSPGETRCWACQQSTPGAPEWPSRCANGAAPRIILAALEAGPAAACEIAAQTGLSRFTVKATLTRLRHQGAVTFSGPRNRPVYSSPGARHRQTNRRGHALTVASGQWRGVRKPRHNPCEARCAATGGLRGRQLVH
jgi:DNA-binding transcriptional ArsR family regulator